jgi:EAL domain-containing protein (putative c-di-GMP-specific phosphodiesterase class I)
MRELQDFGVAFAVDDFGTGYASLGYLKNFTFNQVKIDKMFMADAGTEAHRRFLGSLIRMLHDLDIETLMEGVETEEQAALLRSVGCLAGQGYLFGRPAAIAAHLANLQAAGKK